MELEDVAEVTARIFAHVSSYPPDARKPLEPTLLDAKQRQHEALLKAVAARAGTWSERDRTAAAAVLDVLWGVASYERMVVVTALAEHVPAALQLFLELRLCSREQARQVLDHLEEAAFSEPELFCAALRPPH